jgi:hypothetical protein
MWLLRMGGRGPGVYIAFGPAPGQAAAPPMISGPIVAAVTGLSLFGDRRRFAGGRTAASLNLEPA